LNRHDGSVTRRRVRWRAFTLPEAPVLVPMLFLVAAAAAAIAAALVQAREVRELRDRLDHLAQPAPVAASEPAEAALRPRAAMFGALYEAPEPSALDRLREAPGTSLVGASALLALLGAVALGAHASGDRRAAAEQAAGLVAIRASHDSLAVQLAALRDSVRAASSVTATLAARSAAAPAPRPRPARATVARTAEPALPPMPKMPAIGTPASR
jgi:hypothetical protein